ncbi:MAG: glycerophosphoryl diester phosphodiesterase membrane domain-containing protein [Phormidesmis sp.]
MNPSAASEPIETGSIIATGWRLYRTNFARYVLIALKASLWLLLPLFLVSPISWLLTAQNAADYAGLLALLIPILFVLGLLCYAEYLGLSTGISRLAYQSLGRDVGDGAAETELEALRFTRSRKYSLLWENILRGLIFFLAYAVFFVVALILVVIAIAVSGSGLADGDPSTIFSPVGLAIGLLFAIGTLVFICFFIWLAMRLMLADQPLAIEPGSSATQAIKRSWTLVEGNVLRSLLVMIVTYLIVIPVVFVSSIIGQLIAYQLLNLAIAPPPGETVGSLAEGLPIFIGAAVSGIVSTFGSAVMLPLWHTMLTALYVQLRSRKDREAVEIDVVG